VSGNPAIPPDLLAAARSLPVSLLVFDAGRRLVFANDRLWSRIGVDPAMVPPGTELAGMARMLALRGVFGPGDPEAQAAEAMAIDRSRPSRRILRGTDGRVDEVHSIPLPGGGFATCVIEVTSLVTAADQAHARRRVLEGVLARMRTGISLFDPGHRLVLHNPSHERLSGAPDGTMTEGMSQRAVLDALAALGEFESDPAYAERLLSLDRGREHVTQRRRPDGTVVRFVSSPVEGGGYQTEAQDVTQMVQAEADARRRAALLNGVLAALPHGVCVYGPDQRVAMLNAAYGRIMEGVPVAVGDHREDILARRVAAGEYAPEEVEDIRRQELGIARAQPQHRRRTRPNGTALDVRSAPLPDGGHVIVVTDVTELQRAEAEAKHRADILQATLDHMRHGICLYDAEGRILLANRLAARMSGIDPAELRPGRSVHELQVLQRRHGEFAADPETEERLNRPGRLWHEPARYVRRRPDGTVLEVATSPMPGGGWVRTYTDITPIARAEAEAKHRADIAQAMMENLRDGICLFDEEERVVAANALAARRTGLDVSDFAPGRSLDELLLVQAARGEFGDGAEAGEYLSTRIGTPVRVPSSYARTRPDGTILEVTTDPMPGGGFIRTYRDVTEERRIREELQRAKEEAEAASRAKSRFLATMSHELRTPLNAVIGFSEALLGPHDPASAPEFARAINEAGRHLLSLIDDILDVARSQAGALELQEATLDPGALAEAMMREVRPAAAEAGLSLATELPPGLPRLRADERRLRQILRSLLSNAVKFTPRGGTVTLGARLGPAGLSLSVADTGIGMSAAEIPRALEPFTQLDASLARRFQGSGLGLHLARSLSESLGGALSIESEPGHGTRVVVVLPAACLVASPATTTPPPSETVELP
jgi:PAS domain S-box-containing protein